MLKSFQVSGELHIGTWEYYMSNSQGLKSLSYLLRISTLRSFVTVNSLPISSSSTFFWLFLFGFSIPHSVFRSLLSQSSFILINRLKSRRLSCLFYSWLFTSNRNRCFSESLETFPTTFYDTCLKSYVTNSSPTLLSFTFSFTSGVRRFPHLIDSPHGNQANSYLSRNSQRKP